MESQVPLRKWTFSIPHVQQEKVSELKECSSRSLLFLLSMGKKSGELSHECQ